MSASTAEAPSIRGERLRLQLRSARAFARQFVGRRSGLIGLVIIVFFTILAIAPGALVGPLQTVTNASPDHLAPPSLAEPLGTDALGRSVLNLTVWGSRISMVIGFLATIVTIVVGVLIGLVAGYAGGWVDALLMRITDLFLVLPTFVLALILAPIILDIVGSDSEVAGIRMTLIVIVVVIGLTSWASTARVIRSQVLSLKERAFVDRARAIGASGVHIMRRHLLPNVVNLIIANTVLTFAGAVLTETTLSFIGLGDPFQPSWGQVLNDAQTLGAPSLGAWWWVAGPATSIVLVVLAFTLVGNAL
ncbi:MAG TPA: ABC transporter permease, partial [Candidatus Binatia bacterium]|nr:ABC transporter permease [Candidatus Binatia bacterium]